MHHDHKTGVLFQAAGDKKTSPLLKDVAMHIVAMKPIVCYPEELDPAIVEKERERLRDVAKKSGKPDNIIDKIVEGQLKTFYNGAGVLTFQPFAKDQAKLVKLAHKYTEHARVVVRNVRREGMELLKKLDRDGKMGKDEHHKNSGRVQELTDKLIKEVDQTLAGKETEIKQV